VEVKVPGRPAQVLALDGRVLVSIRDPGLLVILRPDAATGLVELARVALPADAWGLAVTPDEATVLVTSAWSHKVSGVDLASGALRWTVDVPREPRAVVARADGAGAYVTHLVGADVTRLEGIGGASVRVASIALPPGPLFASTARQAAGLTPSASLGYAAALSPEGDRLFVARHMLPAAAAWRDARATVDVLLTADDTALAPVRTARGLESVSRFQPYEVQGETHGPVSLRELPLEQPRAVAYRASARTLLVVGERGAARSDSRAPADVALAELDARALDPTLAPVHTYPLASSGRTCGAPSGLALSADEAYAWVWCRATDDLSVIALAPDAGSIVPSLPVATSPFDERTTRGRQTFFDHCARCHPEGRDDGHVWHEQHWAQEPPYDLGWLSAGVETGSGAVRTGRGVPRQTPMLAGRVDARRPYGWRGQHVSIEQHVTTAFAMHGGPTDGAAALAAAHDVVAYLRAGLVTPPAERRALTAQEARGEEIFGASETRCSSCHFSGTGFTDRALVPMGAVETASFDAEPDASFKTPSLLFVGGTAPYFHDGRFATLEELVERNRDRMGHTSQLGPEDRAALVAYLRTIGVVTPGTTEDVASTRPASEAAIPPLAPLADARGPRSTSAFDPLAAPAEAPSPPPTWPEWKSAPEVSLPRIAKQCRLYRVREWFRAHCDADPDDATESPSGAGRAAMIVGSARGVELTRGRYGGGADAVFPMREGDRRVFELNRIAGHSRCAVFWDVAAVVSASWLPGEPGPTVVMQ
jgi:mono/diheme cytochrome c family protein